jgi:hypothetical protein
MPRPRFTTGEGTPGTHCTGGWVGPTASLDAQATEKIFAPAEDRISVPVVRHKTDWASSPAQLKKYMLLSFHLRQNIYSKRWADQVQRCGTFFQHRHICNVFTTSGVIIYTSLITQLQPMHSYVMVEIISLCNAFYLSSSKSSSSPSMCLRPAGNNFDLKVSGTLTAVKDHHDSHTSENSCALPATFVSAQVLRLHRYAEIHTNQAHSL